MTTASELALLGSGGFLLVGLLTGTWKYSHMMADERGTAPRYVNVAHRAALLYSFASLVIYEFARISPYSRPVTLIAVAVPLVFFGVATGSYVVHGVLQYTDNQFRDPANPVALRAVMWALIVGEIGGFLLLYVGFVSTL